MNYIKQSVTIISIAILTGFCSCTDRETTSNHTWNEHGREYFQPIPLTVEESNIITTQTEAAFNIFKAINDSKDEANIFFSPLSFTFDLSMIANGATAETQDQIKDLLGTSSISMSNVNSLNRLLLDELPVADRESSLSLANSVWVDNKSSLKSDFKNTVEYYYDAMIKNVDLSSDKESTNGLRSPPAD